jgi:hypothetical protein
METAPSRAPTLFLIGGFGGSSGRKTLCQCQSIYHVGAPREYCARNIRPRPALPRKAAWKTKSMLGTILLILLILALLGGLRDWGRGPFYGTGYYGGGGLGLLLLVVVLLVAAGRI